MKRAYRNILLITAVSYLAFSCEEEEPFICETNTIFVFAGASEKWCGRSELRNYEEINSRETANIFVRYPAGNVTLLLNKDGQFRVGELLNQSNGFNLSGDIGSINSTSLTFTKIDREEGLVSFTFSLDYHAQSNLTHWDVTGTVTDLSLEIE